MPFFPPMKNYSKKLVLEFHDVIDMVHRDGILLQAFRNQFYSSNSIIMMLNPLDRIYELYSSGI